MTGSCVSAQERKEQLFYILSRVAEIYSSQNYLLTMIYYFVGSRKPENLVFFPEELLSVTSSAV